MPGPFDRGRRFLRELKRRSVYQVAATYVVVAFVGLQAVKLLIPSTTLPSWADELILAFLIVGFPVSLVVAWAFELTPEGVRRSSAAEVAEEAGVSGAGIRGGSGLAMKGLVGLGLLGAAVVGVWYLTGAGEPEVTDRSVAVLPFTNMGGEESEQFTQGVHDDLLTRLSNLSGLKVISRTSVMRYEDTDMALPEIARELDVKWVVEGGVQRISDQIKVNAQLIDPRTDTHAWADQYQRDLTAANLFAIQSEITKEIARELQTELTREEAQRIERQPTDNLEAYRLYVQGRGDLNRRTEEGMRRAVGFFRQAIRVDSSYAPAWAGLADARMLLTYYGYADPPSTLRRAREAARTALELNPDLADAHASMGNLLVGEHDAPGALRAFKRAVELKPSYAQGRTWLGEMLTGLGRLTEGLPEARTGAKLDPMSPLNRVVLAYHYLFADSLEKALHEARTAVDLAPRMSLALEWVGAILSEMGRQAEAISTLQRALEETDPGPAGVQRIRSRLAVAHVRAGDTATARGLLDEIETDSPFYPGLVYAQMGDADSALAALGRTDFKYVHVYLLRYSPVLDPVRDDPRFQQLLRRVNQAWGLNPDGSIPPGDE